MNFYECNLGSQQGIANRHAGMGKRGRIDDDEVDALPVSLMNPFDDFVFGIALPKIKGVAQRLRQTFDAVLDVLQSLAAV